MKRNYLIILAAIFSMHSIAQVEFEQGTFLLEMGSTGFKSQNVSSYEGLGPWPDDLNGYINGTNMNTSDAEFGDIFEKINITEINANIGGGYFVVDGLCLGLGVSYTSKTENFEYTNDYKNLSGEEDYSESGNELIISPMLRYYFGESGFWTQFSYGIATLSEDHSDGSTDDAEFPKRSAMQLAAGYAISLNDYVSLNPAIGYNLTTQTTKDAGYNSNGENIDEVVKSGSLGVGISLTVHLSSY